MEIEEEIQRRQWEAEEIQEHPSAQVILGLVDQVPEIHLLVDRFHAFVYKACGDVKPGLQAFEALSMFEDSLDFKRLVNIVQEVLDDCQDDNVMYPSGVVAAEFAPSKTRPFAGAVEEAKLVGGRIVCDSLNVVTVDALQNADCDWPSQDKNQLHIVTSETAARGHNVKGVWDEAKIPQDKFLKTKSGGKRFYGLMKIPNKVHIKTLLPNGQPKYERFGHFAGGALHKGIITPKLDGTNVFLKCKGGKAWLMYRGGSCFVGSSTVDCKVGFEFMPNGDWYLTWVKSYSTIPNMWGWSMQVAVRDLLELNIEGTLVDIKLPPVLAADLACDLPKDGIVVHTFDAHQFFYKDVNTCDLDEKTLDLVTEHLCSPGETGEAVAWQIDPIPGPGIWEYDVYPNALRVVKEVGPKGLIPKRRRDKSHPNALHNVLKAVHSITTDEYKEYM